jgi:hypothetical protein
MPGGAVPGASMAAVRRRWRATAIGAGRDAPSQGDTQWLVAEALAAWDRIDALTGALARAVGGERWAEPVYAPGALVQVASWRCRFCGERASPQEHIAHTADCPVRVLVRARGGTDADE